jgi:hypothetical protein
MSILQIISSLTFPSICRAVPFVLRTGDTRVREPVSVFITGGDESDHFFGMRSADQIAWEKQSRRAEMKKSEGVDDSYSVD